MWPFKSKDQAGDPPSSNNGQSQFVNILALIIIILSAAILTILIIMASDKYTNSDEKAFIRVKDLINILLPLISTWMGTILAFYFSKENFKIAAESNSALMKQVTGIDKKLQELKASDIMSKRDIFTLQVYKDENDFRSQKISDILKILVDSNSERLVVLEKDTFKFIFLIYRTTIERFKLGITEGKITTAKQPPPPVNDLTVDDMLRSNYTLIKDIINIKNCFLPLTATLSEVKEAMQDNSICQDVFITKTGSKDEAVEGWITNDMIIEKAELFKKAGK